MPAGRDQIDLANEVADLHRQIAIQKRKPEGPTATGLCLACEESVPDGRRWCDASCRDEWEKGNR